MRILYESLLDADIEDQMQDSVADWIKNTVWSKSNVKNFIYKELQGKVKFKVPKNHKLVVDDYILLYENQQDKIVADQDNNRKDKTFSYILYGTNLDKLKLNTKSNLTGLQPSKVPTIEPWSRSNCNYHLTFRVRFGSDDPNKDLFHKYYWPEKDGQWVIYMSSESNKRKFEYITTWQSNFDGHIPSKDLR